MNIMWLGGDRFRLKTKQAVIQTGHPIRINQIELAGPGEYEVAGVECRGLTSSIYLFEVEDLRVAYFGRLSKRPASKELEKLGTIDILLAPLGNNFDSAAFKQIIADLEPKLVIPCLVDDSAESQSLLNQFCQDNQVASAKDNLKIKKTDLGEETEIQRLRAQK